MKLKHKITSPLHLYYRADELEILTKSPEKRIMLNHAFYFSLIFSMIFLSRLLVSRLLLLSTDWEHTFHVCLICRNWQQVLGKWSQ